MKISIAPATTPRSPTCLKPLLIGLLTFGSIAAIHAAEEFELTNGNRFPASSVKVTATGFTTSVGEGAGLRTINFTAKEVARANFAAPKELAEARSLLANGMAEAALTALNKAEPALLPYRAIPDSWWQQLAILRMDALAVLGKRREATAVVSAELMVELSPENAATLKGFQQLVAQAPKDAMEKTQVLRGLVGRTSDGWITARTWLEIGNSLADQGNIEEAIKAWLRVPVFFPTEQDLAVRGTILAARGMQQIKHPEDGVKLLRDYLVDQTASPFTETINVEIAKLEPTFKKAAPPVTPPISK
jgi:tetratricopeptide (TPR) repeat protein